MASHPVRRWLTRFGAWTAHPSAFAVLAAYGVLWFAVADTFGFAEAVTLATLFIQRAERRDTQALHAKLDERLRAHGEAQTELNRLDEEEPEDIERHRMQARGGR